MSKASTPVIQSHHVIPFTLGGLEAISVKDSLFVSVRHLCDAFGVDFNGQRKKLAKDPKWTCGLMSTHDTSGRKQEMLTLPLDEVSGFLYSINVNKVNPETREALLKYQKECTKALNAYWSTGKAERSDALTVMRLVVTETMQTLQEEYPEIYNKSPEAKPHHGLYAKIQETLNTATFGLKKLSNMSRGDLPKEALVRIKDAARVLNKALLRGATVAEACKKVREAFPEPALRLSV